MSFKLGSLKLCGSQLGSVKAIFCKALSFSLSKRRARKGSAVSSEQTAVALRKLEPQSFSRASLSPTIGTHMRVRVVLLAAMLLSSFLEAQIIRLPGDVSRVSTPATAHTGRVLTIDSYRIPLGTGVMDLEKIGCHFVSSSNDKWVITCDSEDLPNHKDRSLILVSRRNDGSSCELTVRFDRPSQKWDVQINSRLAEPCLHSWLDEDTIEFHER